MIEQAIDVRAKTLGVNSTKVPESCSRLFCRNELPTAKRAQLPDRRPIAGNDERLAAIEIAHDRTTVVAELTLGDLTRHSRNVARVLCVEDRLLCFVCAGLRAGRLLSGLFGGNELALDEREAGIPEAGVGEVDADDLA